MLPITTKLAGTSQPQLQENVKKYGGAGLPPYELVREPDNPYDSNAIKVALFGHFDLEYIPRQLALYLAPLLDEGEDLVAEFIRLNTSPYHEQVGITVKIKKREEFEMWL